MARASIKIDKANNTIIITMPLEPAPSASGKMLLLTSTRGNQETETMYDEKPVYANVNIGIYSTPKS